MHEIRNIVVVQTAFLGDVVLTLPLIQSTRRFFPAANIDVVAIPRTSGVLQNHPAINRIVEFDKKGKDSGITGLFRMCVRLRERRYDVALVPHRSLRSALLVKLAGIPIRVGFHRSTGRLFFTHVIRYDETIHEIERNLSLLGALEISWKNRELPSLYPSSNDQQVVANLLRSFNISEAIIALAPGTIWNTKRWLKERFAELARRLVDNGMSVILMGGKEDETLCKEIRSISLRERVFIAAGKLSFLQSAELLRRCQLLVCNDSAPLHLAVAMRTPVAAIFGATIPEFGFAPYGDHDVVVETKGLKCRPCSIHGGDACPIRTFVCMKEITTDIVLRHVQSMLAHVRVQA